MTELENKVALALSGCWHQSPMNWDESVGTNWGEFAPAAIAVVRAAVIEECAKVAENTADAADKWEAILPIPVAEILESEQAACRHVAANIRALAAPAVAKEG